MYDVLPSVNPVAFSIPSVKVVGSDDEVSILFVINPDVNKFEYILQFEPTLPIETVCAFTVPIFNIPGVFIVSIDGVNKFVLIFAVPVIVKLLPWILPVVDNELPVILPKAVNVLFTDTPPYKFKFTVEAADPIFIVPVVEPTFNDALDGAVIDVVVIPTVSVIPFVIIALVTDGFPLIVTLKPFWPRITPPAVAFPMVNTPDGKLLLRYGEEIDVVVIPTLSEIPEVLIIPETATFPIKNVLFPDFQSMLRMNSLQLIMLN